MYCGSYTKKTNHVCKVCEKIAKELDKKLSKKG